jgi:hypothetical protein
MFDQQIGLEETDDGIWSIYFNSPASSIDGLIARCGLTVFTIR